MDCQTKMLLLHVKRLLWRNKHLLKLMKILHCHNRINICSPSNKKLPHVWKTLFNARLMAVSSLSPPFQLTHPRGVQKHAWERSCEGKLALWMPYLKNRCYRCTNEINSSIYCNQNSPCVYIYIYTHLQMKYYTNDQILISWGNVAYQILSNSVDSSLPRRWCVPRRLALAENREGKNVTLETSNKIVYHLGCLRIFRMVQKKRMGFPLKQRVCY